MRRRERILAALVVLLGIGVAAALFADVTLRGQVKDNRDLVHALQKQVSDLGGTPLTAVPTPTPAPTPKKKAAPPSPRPTAAPPTHPQATVVTAAPTATPKPSPTRTPRPTPTPTPSRPPSPTPSPLACLPVVGCIPTPGVGEQ